MSTEAIIAICTVGGALIAAVASVYGVKATIRQSNKASQRDEIVHEAQTDVDKDRVGIEGLTALATEYRKDREEMRKQLSTLQKKVDDLQTQVTELLENRRSLNAALEQVKAAYANLQKYVSALLTFIRGNDLEPPEPDVPLINGPILDIPEPNEG